MSGSDPELENEETHETIETTIRHAGACLALVILAANLVGTIKILEAVDPQALAELQSVIQIGVFGVLAILIVGLFDIYSDEISEAIERARGNVE